MGENDMAQASEQAAWNMFWEQNARGGASGCLPHSRHYGTSTKVGTSNINMQHVIPFVIWDVGKIAPRDSSENGCIIDQDINCTVFR